MLKRPDIKTRKKLRITMCIFYLLQILLCTMPFFQDTKFNEDGLVAMASPFKMFMILFGVTTTLSETVITISIISIALIVIPIIGFFFCALDKERNLKNIVSVLCCFSAVFLILAFIPMGNISIGAILAVLFYIILMFLTSFAMVMRLSKDSE